MSISQVSGYALSKFIGIKVISELKVLQRIPLFLMQIGIALFALFGFSVSSSKLGPLWLFLNGLPLGMIWGIVFSYCEGRKLTEVLTVFISANYILSSGLAKTFGRLMINSGLSEFSMPFMIGLYTLPLLLISLLMLTLLPTPNELERFSKSERISMDTVSRRNFYQNYKVYLWLFILFYIILTCIRDIRDNFAVEIWSTLGSIGDPSIFTKTELPITLIVLIALGLMYKIKNNAKAFNMGLIVCLVGLLFMLIMTTLFTMGHTSPKYWMITSGVGLFLPYILMNGIIFDRFIATFRISANVGFLMYIVDALGYVASISIMIIKNFLNVELNWLDFYVRICIFGSIMGVFLVLILILYIKKSPA